MVEAVTPIGDARGEVDLVSAGRQKVLCCIEQASAGLRHLDSLAADAAAGQRDEDFRSDQPMVAALHPLRRVAAADHDRPGDRAQVSFPHAGLERQRPLRADLDVLRQALIDQSAAGAGGGSSALRAASRPLSG